LIAKRDFLASVQSKAFLFGLVVFPVLFGGGFAATAISQARTNEGTRRVAILDGIGDVDAVVREAEEKNKQDMFDKISGRRVMPKYEFEVIAEKPETRDEQRLELSERVRRRELYAFVELGPEVLHPGDSSKVLFFSGGIDPFQNWFSQPLNTALRQMRLARLGLSADQTSEALTTVPMENMSLIARDPRTGAIAAPHKKGQAESFLVPYVLVMIMMVIVLMSASPMLTAVAEDKMQRVYEMMLSSATPFELIMGKVLAAVGRSLASSVFYIIGGIVALESLAMFGLIPFSALPWFFVYLVAEVTLLSAIGAALGSACSSPQDAQHLAFLLIMPVIIPVMLMTNILQQPNGTSAIVLSLIPPFTPMLMLMRLAMPGGVPSWQPWAGLIGVVLFALAGTWAGARIFRVGILFQGTVPKLPELVKWAVRG
jgi:ABC-type Na+ efflux pump permease subunit